MKRNEKCSNATFFFWFPKTNLSPLPFGWGGKKKGLEEMASAIKSEIWPNPLPFVMGDAVSGGKKIPFLSVNVLCLCLRLCLLFYLFVVVCNVQRVGAVMISSLFLKRRHAVVLAVRCPLMLLTHVIVTLSTPPFLFDFLFVCLIWFALFVLVCFVCFGLFWFVAFMHNTTPFLILSFLCVCVCVCVLPPPSKVGDDDEDDDDEDALEFGDDGEEVGDDGEEGEEEGDDE